MFCLKQKFVIQIVLEGRYNSANGMIVLVECIISTISLIMLKALYSSVVLSVKVACYNYGRRLLAGGEI